MISEGEAALYTASCNINAFYTPISLWFPYIFKGRYTNTRGINRFDDSEPYVHSFWSTDSACGSLK